MLTGDRLPTLVAERVELRWLEDADLAALHRIFSDPEVTRYWSSPAQSDPAQAKALLAGIRCGFEKHSLYQWGIALRETGEIIGTCTFADLDAANRRAEIGFALASAYWRNGLMRETLTRLLDFAFGDLGLHRVEADVDPVNEASLGLLDQLGFVREGYLRERWFVNGAVADTVFLGLLDREWWGRGGTRG